MPTKQYSSVKKILWIILFANFAVAILKLCIGIACQSQSVIADGIHSFADGSSNIVGLIGIWLAAKPKDEGHQYGHGKYETIASLFIGVMLAIMSIRIITRSVTLFRNPVVLDVDFINLALMIVTIIINIIVAVTEFRFGKRLASTILVTDSMHTRGDILISVTVLFVLLGVKLGLPPWIDSVMSFIVAIAVLISAWQIIKNCMDVLVDSSVVKSDEVKKLLMTVPGIYDIHQIRSRGELSHYYIDFHVVVNPNESIDHTHDLAHKLELILSEHFGQETEVSIHFEPDDGRHQKSM